MTVQEQIASLQAQLNALIQILNQLLAQKGSTTAPIVSQPTNPTQNNSSALFTRNLTIGDKGTDVGALKNFLISKGYLAEKDAAISISFDQTTQTALAKFEINNGISPTDGYFGPMVRAQVNAIILSGQTSTIVSQGATVSTPVIIPTTTQTSQTITTSPTVSQGTNFEITNMESSATGVTPVVGKSYSGVIGIYSTSLNSFVAGKKTLSFNIQGLPSGLVADKYFYEVGSSNYGYVNFKGTPTASGNYAVTATFTGNDFNVSKTFYLNVGQPTSSNSNTTTNTTIQRSIVINSINPNPATTANTVTIFGSGFSSSDTVEFDLNGRAVAGIYGPSLQSVTSNQIVFTLDSTLISSSLQQGVTYQVKVTPAYGSNTGSNSVSFQVGQQQTTIPTTTPVTVTIPSTTPTTTTYSETYPAIAKIDGPVSAGGTTNAQVGTPVSIIGQFGTGANHGGAQTTTWNFGDGATKTDNYTSNTATGGVSGVHTYTASGTYTVTLTFTTTNGTVVTSDPIYVKVN